MRVLLKGCGLLACGQFEPKQAKKKKCTSAQVNFSGLFCSDQIKLFAGVTASSKCLHWWKTANQIELCNPAATAAGVFEGLFAPPVCIFPFGLLSLFLSLQKSRGSLCLSAKTQVTRQERANEVPCQSKTWLLIWPLQQGTAEREKDHWTCRQLTSRNATAIVIQNPLCGTVDCVVKLLLHLCDLQQTNSCVFCFVFVSRDRKME